MFKINRKGFTMVELLIVLAIIAILAAVAIPVYSSQLEKSRIEVDNSNLRAATGMASQDFLLRNAAQPWTNFSATNQTSYAVFTYADTGNAGANSKNMMVFPVNGTNHIDSNGELTKQKPAITAGIILDYEANKRTKADREKVVGRLNGKDVCHFPIQQNGGNGYFQITMGPNGVIKESSIKTQ